MERQSLWFTAPFSAEIRTEPLPPHQPDQLLIQTAYSAISAGTEMLIYRGEAPTEMAADDSLEALAGDLAFPLKYGYACVGRVIEMGSQVDAEWRDALVFAFNPHETHFVARPDQVQRVPEGISAEVATLLPNMETAVSLVMDGRPVIGERVIVFGQGIVGILTAHLLAQFPLANLTIIDPNPHRIALTQSLNPSISQSLISNLQSPYGTVASSDISNNYDLAYELTGNPAVLNDAIAAVGYGGRIVVGSWYGRKSAEIKLGGVFHRNHIQLISTQVSTLAPRWRGRWTKQRRFAVAWHHLQHPTLANLITERVPFTDAPQTYHALAQNNPHTVQTIFCYNHASKS